MRLLAAANKIDEANQLIDASSRRTRKRPRRLALQSDLRLLGGDRAGAKTSLEQAIAADEVSCRRVFALIQILINEKQFDAAAVQLDAARACAR